MGFAAVLRKVKSKRGRDIGLVGFNKAAGTTGGSFVARAHSESEADLGERSSLSELPLPGTFRFDGSQHTYTDQYDRTIELSPEEVQNGGALAVDRICSTYEHEALASTLGRQYSFDPDGSLLFTSEVNNKPMTAVLAPGQRSVSIYLPGQEGDSSAFRQAQDLVPEKPGRVAIRARRAAASSETWEASPRSFRNNPEARKEAYKQEVDAQISKYEYMLHSEATEDPSMLSARVQALGNAGGTFNYLMPEKFDSSYAEMGKRLFGADQRGSRFTELDSLDDLLEEVFDQRGTLQGDDREELIALGADPRSFKKGNRYLMVRTPGILGTVRSSTLADDHVLEVMSQSAGNKPVCVATVSEQAESQYGTIVLEDNPVLPGTENAPGLLLGAFPGVPSEPASSEKLLGFIGQRITVAEGRRIFGHEFSVVSQKG